jgi:hypothetical protein
MTTPVSQGLLILAWRPQWAGAFSFWHDDPCERGPSHFGMTTPVSQVLLILAWRPQWASSFSLPRLSPHIHQDTTFRMTPPDEWSACRWDLYLTTHNTLKTQTSITSASFEPTNLTTSACRLTPYTAWPLESAKIPMKIKQNILWFKWNTTIHIYCILSGRHISVNWPSSGHLYKT